MNEPNVTIRNLICRGAGADGFNLQDAGGFDDNNEMEFEGVCALHNGDEGISAHDGVFMKVTDSVFVLNGSTAGQIADVGSSNTEYIRTVSIGSSAINLFLDGSVHNIEDAVINGTIFEGFEVTVCEKNKIYVL